MRRGFAFLVVVTFIICAGAATSRALAQQGGATLPIPQPAPTLPGQGFNACMVNCNTQAGNCQGSCQSTAPGTNPQCFINCTAAQTVCQANCSTATGR